MSDLYTIDFETYYDRTTYTLSKMQTSSYVRGTRYMTLMVGIKLNNSDTIILSDEQFRALLNKGLRAKLNDSMILCHHAHFDGLILSHHYNVEPKLYLDTLSMSRAVAPMAKSHSLKATAQRLDLGVKGTELENTSGKRSLTPEEFQRLAEYCRNDVDLTHAIFTTLKAGFPVSELRLIDMTVKLFTKPMVIFNTELLQEEQDYEIERKRALLERCSGDRSVLASNNQFAVLLESLGVTPPMKPSPAAAKKGELKMTYAFGKADEGFKALLNGENEDVRLLCEARLGVKSTINETRAGRFIEVAKGGAVPVYLTYYGAHTGRFSGGDKMNFQNMTRGSRLRLAIEAPADHQLVVADLSQIEARVLAMLAGEAGLIAAFKRPEGETDVYTDMATRVLHRPVTKKDKAARQLGKALVLGCGYGLGWVKFNEMQRIGMLGAPSNIFGAEMVDALGVSVDGFMVRNGAKANECLPPGWEHRVMEHMTHCACSKAIVDLYRENNPNIVQLWQTANQALAFCAAGSEYKFSIFQVEKEKIYLPNGMYLHYPGLSGKASRQGVEYTKDGKNHKEKVYGGLVVENLTQAVARIVMTDAMLKINKRYRVVLTVHDEVVCCVPDEQAEECYNYMVECLTAPPAFMPEIPLACDGGFAKNYSK